MRLLMQPQVQWEPVQVEPNPEVLVFNREVVHSTTNGVRTLAGADSVKLVPVLPGMVVREIVTAAQQNQSAGALFSLPFGLRAFVRLDIIREELNAIPAVLTEIHEPRFDDLTAAQQLRLTATGGRRIGTEPDPGRGMPGAMRQLHNLGGSVNNLKSVMPAEIEDMLGQSFESFVPLHRADLSGYGLSTFSDWRQAADVGVTQVRFDVLNGRTSYEVIEVRSILACCQARVVRTIILERRNSGRVRRFDSGWKAIDDGEFNRYVPFEREWSRRFATFAASGSSPPRD